MQLFFPTIAVLPDMLPGVLSVLASVVISFVFITVISSYYRFQHIIEMAEDTQPEEMGATAVDILRVQLVRYLAGCARRGTSFSLSLIRLNDPVLEVRIDSPFAIAVKKAVRHDDITCFYNGQTLALLLEAEPDDSEAILARVLDAVSETCPEVSGTLLRVGISSYPGHGLSGKELIETALEALGQTDVDQPIYMPEVIDHDEEDDEADEMDGDASTEDGDPEATTEKSSRGWTGRRQDAMLDNLTGVLKPSAISVYMQRMMSDVRLKKKKASLFCLGVNNMDHIARFHGETVADDVLAGVSKILQDNVRSDDLIGRHEKNAFLVLVQIPLNNAEIIGKRLSTLVQQGEMVSGSKKLKTTVTLGVAAYPEHGRNLHSLYRCGQKVLDYSRANDIRAYAVYDPKIHDIMPSKPMKNIKSIQA